MQYIGIGIAFRNEAGIKRLVGGHVVIVCDSHRGCVASLQQVQCNQRESNHLQK
jgi:hypothetical protein